MNEEISSMSRLCNKSEESIAHIYSECLKLAQMPFKSGNYGSVAKVLY